MLWRAVILSFALVAVQEMQWTWSESSVVSQDLTAALSVGVSKQSKESARSAVLASPCKHSEWVDPHILNLTRDVAAVVRAIDL